MSMPWTVPLYNNDCKKKTIQKDLDLDVQTESDLLEQRIRQELPDLAR